MKKLSNLDKAQILICENVGVLLMCKHLHEALVVNTAVKKVHRSKDKLSANFFAFEKSCLNRSSAFCR